MFFILVTIYISVRFEFKMAIAAIIAVFHDILVTVGIYSIAGFQVTPDTVVAVLTVLGYSLYDTVVVFDRIRDNSKGLGASGRVTYSDMVNLSMNQTLARSINTSLVAIVPVLSVLVVGSFILGATSLEDFGLALVIGLTSGAYSSIFIASPLLAMIKSASPGTPPSDNGSNPAANGGSFDPGRRGGHGRGGQRRRAVVGPGPGPGQWGHPARGQPPPLGDRDPGPPRPPPASRWGRPRRADRGPGGTARTSSGSTRPRRHATPPRPRKGKSGKGKGKRR